MLSAKVRRLLGTFLLLMALLAFVDWIIAASFRGSPGVFSGFTVALCPGNGFAAYCGSLLLLLHLLFVAPIGMGLIINGRRKFMMNRDELVALTNRTSLEINLAFYASIAITMGFIWLSISAFRTSGLPLVLYLAPGVDTLILNVVIVLFVLVSGVTGFVLRK